MMLSLGTASLAGLTLLSTDPAQAGVRNSEKRKKIMEKLKRQREKPEKAMEKEKEKEEDVVIIPPPVPLPPTSEGEALVEAAFE